MTDNDWVTVAKEDNSLVAEMLLRLSQSKLPSSSSKPPTAALKVDWTVRQRRSKSAPRKNEGESTRASPSTPLSWSDGTSLTSSGGGGGGGGGGVAGADVVEESSLELAKARCIENVRSKVAVANELANTKRPRRRKTLVQLREEENLLLNERRDLTNKLKICYRNFEVLKGTNENLKRMKLNLQSQATGKLGQTSSVASEETISDQLQQVDADEDQVCSNSATSVACKIPDASTVEKVSYKKPSFVLPDLNLPCEDVS